MTKTTLRGSRKREAFCNPAKTGIRLVLTLALIVTSLVQVKAGRFAPTVTVKNIKGQITDINGQPLVNVTVQVKGSNRTTASDDQGYYSLSADEGAILVFSSVGYKTREEAVKGK